MQIWPDLGNFELLEGIHSILKHLTSTWVLGIAISNAALLCQAAFLNLLCTLRHQGIQGAAGNATNVSLGKAVLAIMLSYVCWCMR